MNGGQVEVADKYKGKWETKRDDYWSFGSCNYRIKEEPKIEYVPFTIEDIDLFMGKIVKKKGKGDYSFILRANESIVYTWDNSFYYSQALEYFTFLDGTPFGKLKQ